MSVQPPLLGELLGRALREAQFEVIVVDGDARLAVEHHYDLAVVSDDGPIDAEVVIRLPTDGEASGTARTPGGVEMVDVGDVRSVVDTVRRLA